MREQFIPYKQALELRDLGFNEKCLVTESKEGYARNPSTDMEELPIQEPFYWMNSKIHTDNCTLPLWQQAFAWFREKHNILGNVYANASLNGMMLKAALTEEILISMVLMPGEFGIHIKKQEKLY